MQVQDLVGLIVLIVGLVKLAQGPIGRAMADRIRGAPSPVVDPELQAEVAELRGRLAEVEDRLDFAERQLVRVHDSEQLPGGAHR